jgi:tetratricopeptide (TPR) repeat protein
MEAMIRLIAALALSFLVLPAEAASPEASAHSVAVFNLAESNDYRGAIELHEREFEKFKSELLQNNNYTFAVAVAYKELGNYARALEFYRLSLAVEKDEYARPILLERIAEAKMRLGFLDEAEADYKQALELGMAKLGDPRDPNVVRISAGLARLALERKDWSVAYRALTAAYQEQKDTGPGIIKGNPFADEIYDNAFAANRWIYEGIVKSAWELAKAPDSDRAALRAAGFEAVQRLQRSAASEALAQTIARISASDSEVQGEVRARQDWRKLFKEANEAQWSGKSLDQYRNELARSPEFQAEVQRARQNYEARLAELNVVSDGERAQQQSIEAAQAAAAKAAERDRELQCHFMDERKECQELRRQAMVASPPLTTDYLDLELKRQAAGHAKDQIDELDQVMKHDNSRSRFEAGARSQSDRHVFGGRAGMLRVGADVGWRAVGQHSDHAESSRREDRSPALWARRIGVVGWRGVQRRPRARANSPAGRTAAVQLCRCARALFAAHRTDRGDGEGKADRRRSLRRADRPAVPGSLTQAAE